MTSSWSFILQASACNTDTTPTQPHQNSNTHQTKNNTTNVAIQQNSRKLLMMDILMSETCWAHTKWNKIASDIKLVFYSSTISLAVYYMEISNNVTLKLHIMVKFSFWPECGKIRYVLHFLYCHIWPIQEYSIISKVIKAAGTNYLSILKSK